jgi:nucleosome binding factor SPN SPT16 subunit
VLKLLVSLGAECCTAVRRSVLACASTTSVFCLGGAFSGCCRREKQEELLQQKNAETLRRLTAQAHGGDGSGANGAVGRLISQVQAYRSVSDLPSSQSLQVLVDSQREAVLLPIYGIMVPVHITAVKSVTSNVEQETALIRISFNFG